MPLFLLYTILKGQRNPNAVGLFDLKGQLAFYGEYHSNPVNRAIHAIFVPTILWSVFAMLQAWGPSFGSLSVTNTLDLPITLAVPLAFIYATYYIALDSMAGSLYFFVLSSMLIGAHYFVSLLGSSAGLYALAIHISSWIFQFIGHGVFEGRSPALLDNPQQAFLLAPLFVFLEILFSWGYRPDLEHQVAHMAQTRIHEWKRSSSKSK
eukprot:TRINITY_DN5012_c0_g1_i6.p1 TRINITY_DN5012_c0_g1~~TRINITY_DN5012_c0_g1_i6.p1  ORF type:complete len:208 (+),score=44.69 TRINITY_DN5012_c0_g1_i6:61-684(+)